MKKLTFNKNSWHFLLATKLGHYREPYSETYTRNDGSVRIYTRGDSGDICTYSKYVMGGIMFAALIGILIGIVGFFLWHVVFGIYFSLILGTWFFSDWGTATMITVGIVGFSFVIVTSYNFTQKFIRKYKERPINKPDGFVKHAYSSWKSKFCVPINFVESK